MIRQSSAHIIPYYYRLITIMHYSMMIDFIP